MIKTKKFKHKITGEIVTQVPVLQMSDYHEISEVAPLQVYTIKLQAYPQEFIVTAASEQEAMHKATERFGRSVYESKVLEIADLS